jgi:Lrp/AsnC family leucine-responsive transcriptional regulator
VSLFRPYAMTQNGPEPSKLDSYDLNILRTLAADGRISWRDLAEKIGLSLTPTLRRVRRLEEEQYIQGYAARLNERQLGGTLNVIVGVSLEKQSDSAFQQFEDEIVKIPEVIFCSLMTGKPDYIINVLANNVETFERVHGRISRIPAVAKISSSFLMKVVRPRRPPLTE